MGEAREALAQQFRATAKDTSVLETELSRLRSEQRNLATAVATGGDAIPELAMELKRRNERIRLLEADVAAAKRSPQMAAEMLAQAEGRVRKKVENLRETLLATQGDTGDVFQEVLREGVELEEAEIKEESGRTRRVWRIRGSATLDAFSLDCDPTGDEDKSHSPDPGRAHSASRPRVARPGDQIGLVSIADETGKMWIVRVLIATKLLLDLVL